MKAAGAALSVLVLLAGAAADAQNAAGPSIWSGVFTAAQAQRGNDAYQASCAGCHGSDLHATDAEAVDLTGPAIAGQVERKNAGRTVRDHTGHDAAGECEDPGRQDLYGHPGVHSSVQRLSAGKSGARARDGEGDRVRAKALKPAIASSRIDKEKAMSSNRERAESRQPEKFPQDDGGQGHGRHRCRGGWTAPEGGRGRQHQVGSVGGCGGGRCRRLGARVRVRGPRYRRLRDHHRGEFRHRRPRHHERRQHPARRRAQPAEEIRHGGLGRHDFRGLDPARSPGVPLQRPRHRPQVRRRKRGDVRVPAGPRRPVHRS